MVQGSFLQARDHPGPLCQPEGSYLLPTCKFSGPNTWLVARSQGLSYHLDHNTVCHGLSFP